MIRLAGFDLDRYIVDGKLGFQHSDATLRIHALFARDAAITLHETPVSRDQCLSVNDEDTELFVATVPDTLELRAWLRSYGSLVEVLKPKALRDEFAKEAKALTRRYADR